MWLCYFESTFSFVVATVGKMTNNKKERFEYNCVKLMLLILKFLNNKSFITEKENVLLFRTLQSNTGSI